MSVKDRVSQYETWWKWAVRRKLLVRQPPDLRDSFGALGGIPEGARNKCHRECHRVVETRKRPKHEASGRRIGIAATGRLRSSEQKSEDASRNLESQSRVSLPPSQFRFLPLFSLFFALLPMSSRIHQVQMDWLRRTKPPSPSVRGHTNVPRSLAGLWGFVGFGRVVTPGQASPRR